MALHRRHLLGAMAATPFAATPLHAAESALMCIQDAETIKRATDWPNLSRYRTANTALLASGAPINVIFLGDSITQGWPDKRPAFFTQGRICRGIGGQTTPQMVLRMMADVVALKPRMVHILAGTNDIAENTGPISTNETLDNLAAMALLAKAHGIKVLLGSVPPAASFPWRPGLETVQAIISVNRGILALAKQIKAHYIDYHSPLSNQAGGMLPGMSYDGVHPDIPGYAVMESVFLAETDKTAGRHRQSEGIAKQHPVQRD